MRNRISGEEDHLSMSDVCTLEKEYFAASTNFNPYVCETTVGKLVKKLENLQWDVYKENLPGLEAKVCDPTRLYAFVQHKSCCTFVALTEPCMCVWPLAYCICHLQSLVYP